MRKNKKLKTIIIITCIVAFLLLLVIAANYIYTKYTTIHPIENLRIETKGLSQSISWDIENERWYYEVYKAEGDEDFSYVETVEAGDEAKAYFSGLSFGTVYRYQVIAVTSFLKKEYKAEGVSVKDHTLTDSVNAATAVADGTDTIKVSWTKPQNIAAYELRWGKTEDFSDAEVLELTENEYTFTGLEDDTTYYFSVRAYSTYKDKDYPDKYYSDWCKAASAKTDKKLVNVRLNGVDYSLPMVALTFDDGPDYSGVTDRILNKLYEYGGYGTFFQLGNKAWDLAYLFNRMVNEGHEVGCHTYDHSHMNDAVTRDDIVSANDAIESACGVRPSAFRSPGGYTTSAIRNVCAEENQALYYWTIDTRDWESRDAASVINIVKSQVSDGAIILMHNIYESTADAVDVLVPWLAEQGYQMVTVSELIYAKTGAPPEAGVQYYSGYRWD